VNAATLIETLQAQQVTLSLVEDRIHYAGPPKALGEQTLQALRTLKAELVAVLVARSPEQAPIGAKGAPSEDETAAEESWERREVARGQLVRRAAAIFPGAETRSAPPGRAGRLLVALRAQGAILRLDQAGRPRITAGRSVSPELLAELRERRDQVVDLLRGEHHLTTIAVEAQTTAPSGRVPSGPLPSPASLFTPSGP
jgi:hypothetical protein